MQIIDPGHAYSLFRLDYDNPAEQEYLRFVKREGPDYPGNVGHNGGTNMQDVIRCLIDRLRYIDQQQPDNGNQWALDYLRKAMWYLEERAARRHGRELWYNHVMYAEGGGIEDRPFCQKCGHIGCEGGCR